jgi:hypothetical protein
MEQIDFSDRKHQPSIEGAGFVINAVLQHMQDGGSFRHLIYDRLGYDSSAYAPLYMAGGMDVSNLCPVKEPERVSSIVSLKIGMIVTEIRDTRVGLADGKFPIFADWKGTRAPVVGEKVVYVYIVSPGSGIPTAYPMDEQHEWNAAELGISS